jgi:hypothetical protein
MACVRSVPNVGMRAFLIIISVALLRHILTRSGLDVRLCYSFAMKKILLLSSLLIIAPTLAAEEEERIINSSEFSVTIEAKTEYATNACMANLEIEYYQKGSSAHVEALLTNDHCAASSGSFVIQIRYSDAEGKYQSKDFPETWARSDSESVVIEKDYFVADDIDVTRVRSRGLYCECVPDEAEDSD